MPYHDTNIIDEYLSGRMKDEDLTSFKLQVQQDADLRAAVEERKNLLVAINAFGDIQMKERAKRIHEIATSPSTKVRQLPVWRYAAAVAAVLAIGFGIWIWLQSPAAPTDLYAQFYAPYSLSFSTRDLSADQQLSQASELYKNGNYENVLPILEELLNKKINNKGRIKLAAGISHLEIGNDNQARSYFQALIANVNSPYYEQGLWYAAMLSLRKGDVASTKRYLQELINETGSFNHEEAEEILGKLE